MNLLLRMLWVLLTASRRKPLGVFDPSVLRFCVLPNDLDIYGHMNNGRYLTIMDLGRFDLLIRTGLAAAARHHKWTPLVAGLKIRYRRSLTLGQRYTLTTRLAGWDEKWIFIEQQFESRGELAAIALVRGILRGRDGNIPTARLLDLVGWKVPSPPLPPETFD